MLSKKANPNSAPKLFNRQRQLLQLLDALGGEASKVDFQKLLFLYCQEAPSGTAPYDFVPHRFGAFSFTSHQDRRKLIERGLIHDDENGWRITSTGRKAIGRTTDMQLAAFVRKNRARGDALVADTYRRYPFFAIRSEIADRLLSDDAVALSRIKAIRRKTTGSKLSTIGYEGHTLESYLNRLIRSGVSLLCDVRRNPLSRKYGFSKGTLARACENVGIRYEHIPALGIASGQRQALESQADYDALFDDYERNWLPNQGDALQTVEEWINSGEQVALTCFEKQPHQCHRHCVAEALEARTRKQAPAKHL